MASNQGVRGSSPLPPILIPDMRHFRVLELADVFDDFLPDDEFHLLARFALEQDKSFTQRTREWPDTIIQDSEEIRISEAYLNEKPVPLRLFEERVRSLQAITWPPKAQLSLQVYDWPSGAYIPAHDDGQACFSLSFYLNEVWNENWGGDLLFSPGTEHSPGMWVSPRRNRLVITKAGTRHKTTLLSRSAEPRRSVQGFVALPRDRAIGRAAYLDYLFAAASEPVVEK